MYVQKLMKSDNDEDDDNGELTTEMLVPMPRQNTKKSQRPPLASSCLRDVNRLMCGR